LLYRFYHGIEPLMGSQNSVDWHYISCVAT